MKKPTFFISSTIYDFHDLRSSLKYYLESQGCVVLASEYNDFQKPLDPHSYDACLESIKSADYFILLVGSRIGGWYNEKERVSITQMEYRTAYDLQKEGKIKLINFVRQEVWQSKNDRKELAKFLETLEINKTTREQINNHPSKHLEDADFIVNFIEEVSKTVETKDSTKNGTELPQSNWIHVFSEFKDIIDVLNNLTIIATPVEELMLISLLKKELYEILKKGLIKNGGIVLFDYSKNAINNFRNKYPIKIPGWEKDIVCDRNDWQDICMISYNMISKKFDLIAIKRILSTPSFIDFNRETKTYEFREIFDAISLLKKEIDSFTLNNTTETIQFAFYSAPHKFPNQKHIQLSTLKTIKLLAVLNKWVNIIELSKSLINHFNGRSLDMPKLQPDSPVETTKEKNDKETLTEKDLSDFLNN
jgi:hypothetical protein